MVACPYRLDDAPFGSTDLLHAGLSSGTFHLHALLTWAILSPIQLTKDQQ